MKAQRLLEAEAARDSLQRRLEDCEQRAELLQREKEAAEQGLARAAQPTSYLVGRLRDEETLRVGVQGQLEGVKKQLTASSSSLQRACEENVQLRQRLVGLLQQRGELQGLRQLLEMQRKQEEEGRVRPP